VFTQLSNLVNSFYLPGIHFPPGSTSRSRRLAVFAVQTKASKYEHNLNRSSTQQQLLAVNGHELPREFLLLRFQIKRHAGTRNVFMVADLDETQMTELMLIVSKKLGTQLEFTPVIPGAATVEIAAKAIENVKKVPI